MTMIELKMITLHHNFYVMLFNKLYTPFVESVAINPKDYDILVPLFFMNRQYKFPIPCNFFAIIALVVGRISAAASFVNLQDLCKDYQSNYLNSKAPLTSQNQQEISKGRNLETLGQVLALLYVIYHMRRSTLAKFLNRHFH